MTGPTPSDDSGDLLMAVTERALARAVLGAAVAGAAAGAIATAFLVVSSGRVGAGTLPVVVLLLLGQTAGLVAAAGAALRLRRVRAGDDPRGAAAATDRALRVTVTATTVAAGLLAAGMPVLLEPRATAALTSAVGLGVLAQVCVVLTVLRRPLRRVARAPHVG
ncbi:MAG: hypothetical protein ACLGIV_05390 [Actinomycetes bacterium]